MLYHFKDTNVHMKVNSIKVHFWKPWCTNIANSSGLSPPDGVLHFRENPNSFFVPDKDLKKIGNCVVNSRHLLGHVSAPRMELGWRWPARFSSPPASWRLGGDAELKHHGSRLEEPQTGGTTSHSIQWAGRIPPDVSHAILPWSPFPGQSPNLSLTHRRVRAQFSFTLCPVCLLIVSSVFFFFVFCYVEFVQTSMVFKKEKKKDFIVWFLLVAVTCVWSRRALPVRCQVTFACSVSCFIFTSCFIFYWLSFFCFRSWLPATGGFSTSSSTYVWFFFFFLI